MMTESSLYLLIAITFGVLGTSCLKLMHTLQKTKPVILLIIFYLISFVALTLAIQGMQMSIIYALWSGLGTILIAVIGFFIFNESLDSKKIISLIFIAVGILGINLTNAFH